ncbi:MAG: VanZ family protein [Fibrobacterota bacterium]
MAVLTSLPGSGVVNSAVMGRDKLAHGAGYLVFGVLLTFFPVCRRWLRPKAAGVAAFCILALYGVLDEVHQLYIPGRDGSVYDWYADIAGGAAGVLLAVAVLSRRPFTR